MTESFDESKGKNTKIHEKHSGDPRSTSTSANAPEKTILTAVNNKNQRVDFAEEIMTKKVEINISKTQAPFSIESEIAKIKISIPLTELVTQDVYRSQLLKALNIGYHNDSVNLNDDKT